MEEEEEEVLSGVSLHSARGAARRKRIPLALVSWSAKRRGGMAFDGLNAFWHL